MPTTSNSPSQLTTSIETALPFVLAFNAGYHRAMTIYDEVKHRALCVEARFLLNGAEYIEFELCTTTSTLPRHTQLYFGAVVYLVSYHKQKKRYLSGHAWHSRLTWSTKCSDKTMFRIVSRDHAQGPLQVDDQLCLQSMRWPQCYVSFASSPSTQALGGLVLKRHFKNAVQLSAMNAVHREYSLSSLRSSSNSSDSVPTVYVSEECYTTTIEVDGDTDVEDAVYVLTPLSMIDQPSIQTYSAQLFEQHEVEMAFRADWRESIVSTCRI